MDSIRANADALRRLTVAGFLLLTLVGGLLGQVTCVPSVVQANAIRGYIRFAGGGVIPDAVVRVYRSAFTSGEPVVETVADNSGFFHIPNVAPGKYFLRTGIRIPETDTILALDFSFPLMLSKREDKESEDDIEVVLDSQYLTKPCNGSSASVKRQQP